MDRTRPHGRQLVYAGQLLALAIAYAGLGELGLAMAPVNGFATLVCPPSGMALAVLVVGGYRLWPGIAVGAFVANLWMGAPPLVATGIAAGNTVDAVVGAFALRSIPGFRGSLDRFREAVGLVVLAGMLTTAVSATVSTVSLTLGGVASTADFARTWLLWWTGDISGDLVVAPVLLTLARAPPTPPRPAVLAEAATLSGFLLACAVLLFVQRPEAGVEIPIFHPYVLILPLIWAALRYGVRGAAIGTFAVAVAAVWGTYTGHGPFVRADRVESMIALHVFLVSASLATLVLGSVVSERERSRKELRESEERQRLAVEAAHLGTWFWDLKSDRLVWTPLCRSMHGIGSDEEVSYARLIAMLHPDERETAARAVKRSLEEHAEYRTEHRVVWPDGSVHWLSVLGRPFYDEAGEPDRMLGTTIDITSQKRAEQERTELLERERAARSEAQAATRAKERERERLDLTLRLLPVGVFISDAEGRILAINDAVRRLWGKQTPLAQSAAEYDVYRGYRPGASEPIASEEWALARALRGEAPLDEDVEIVSFDGERRTILNSALALRDPDGTITGGVAINVDITDRTQAEQERAREAEFRERFIGILGHDLRTPLSAIVFAAESLRRQEAIVGQAARSLDRIVRSAGRMERMIHDLLDATRTRHGGIPVAPVPGDLAAICRHVLEEIQLTHPGRSVELCSRAGAGGEWDPDRIAQVIQNLVVNALDYSPADTPVEVTIDDAGECVVLEVKNRGPPIPPEVLPDIFDPFRRGKHAPEGRTSQGLGLGLYIAHEIVRAHQGRIRVESDRTRGTTFRVELPRSLARAA